MLLFVPVLKAANWTERTVVLETQGDFMGDVEAYFRAWRECEGFVRVQTVSDFSKAGFKARYQRPHWWSMIGRISHVHVSSE